MAVTYYKAGTDEEKYELCNLIFSELIILDRKLISYKAKPAFEKLLSRYNIKQKNHFNSDSLSFVCNGGGSHAYIEPLSTWVDEIVDEVLTEIKGYFEKIDTEAFEQMCKHFA